MTECRRCGAKAQLFLCPRCTSSLQRTLTDLPWWLNRLTEAAVGQTRMSDNAGRKSAARRDLDGEKTLAACIEPFPDPAEQDLEKARRAREKAALAHALAAGGVNARASELLGEIADSLAYWVKELCDSRGVAYTPPVKAPERLTALGTVHAAWMARNVAAIASSELADDICGDVENHLDDIVRTVNRPVPIRTLGNCPTTIDDQPCGIRLRAPADDLEVHCPRCKTTHNVHRLMLGLMDDLAHSAFTVDELLAAMRKVPEAYRVPERTLRRWRSTGKLKPSGWRGEKPEYAWADVQKLKTTDRRGTSTRMDA